MFTSLLLGTVLLERNRWGSRAPSLRPSSWWERIRGAGFSGLEIWEPHLTVDPAEVECLAALAIPRVMLNSYAPLDDHGSSTRAMLTRAAWALGAEGVKYNVSPDPGALPLHGRVLNAWAADLPPGCRLLCECHDGTALADPEKAAQFLDGLDPQRHGAIVHPFSMPPEHLDRWCGYLGNRLCHLHLQAGNGGCGKPRFLALVDAKARIQDAQIVLRHHRIEATATLEFCHGVADPGEDPGTLLIQAGRDREFLETLF